MRTLQQIQEQFATQSKEIDLLMEHWETMITNATGGVTPTRTQFALWLRLNNDNLDTVLTAIDATARKNHMMGQYRLPDVEAVRYASGCMKSITLGYRLGLANHYLDRIRTEREKAA
jgi:hypothetical protein